MGRKGEKVEFIANDKMFATLFTTPNFRETKARRRQCLHGTSSNERRIFLLQICAYLQRVYTKRQIFCRLIYNSTNDHMNSLKEKKIPIFIALVQWFITTILQVDRLFFSYERESIYFFVTKVLYLFLLLAGWCFIFHAAQKIKSGDETWKRGFFVFKIYFILMMMLLLVLWPGTWSWDDLGTLDAVSHYTGWNPWQHLITGAYYDVLLQILPFPGGIILLQNVFISLCVAFVVTKLEMIFDIGQLRNKTMDITVKLIPFLLPPVLRYQFSGYRMGLYIYLELVMLVILTGVWRDRREWSVGHVISFCALCVIVASWRTESFLYIPCVCIFILFAQKDVLTKRKKVLFLAVLIVGFSGMSQAQKRALGNSNYEVISLLGPCAELVRAADCSKDAEELAAIDRVTDLQVIYDNPTFSGRELYWGTTCVRTLNDNPDDDYTVQDYRNFVKAVVKLSLKYPKVVTMERLKLFVAGSGITGSTITNCTLAAELFESDNGNTAAEEIISKGWFAFSPVCKNTRRILIKILGLQKDDVMFVKVLQRFIWNAIIPELFLLFGWCRFLIKRKWHLLGIFTSVLLKLPVVILTQPSSWLMYVLSFYFLGYIFLVYFMLAILTRHKKAKGQVMP